MESEFLMMFADRFADIWDTGVRHVTLSLLALNGAVLIAVPLGVLLTRFHKLASAVLSILSVWHSIPRLALLGFMIPAFGMGTQVALLSMVVYALLPILRTTFTGIHKIDAALLEAGRGMGMTRFQLLRMLELPLARPMIFAGIRTAAVMTVGVAMLAALIGGVGLDELILSGISKVDAGVILTGAIPVVGLAIAFNLLLAWLDRTLTKRSLNNNPPM